jgi:hypothetical protein
VSCSNCVTSRSTTVAPAKPGAGHVVAGRVGQGVDHVKPKPLRVTLTALDGHPRDNLFDLRGPRPQKDGLPASCGCAGERDGSRSGG